MKNLLFLVAFFICYNSCSQIIPPQDDQEFIEKIFVSQCGMVPKKNPTVRAVFIFRGKEGHGDRIYLLQKNDSVTEIIVPDFLINTHLALINSGPDYFHVQTMDDEKKDYYYYYSGNRAGFLTKFAEKKIRGHDGDNKIHHD